MRGAIAMGEVAVRTARENTTIIGKGFTNAYELEAPQNWAGCQISDDCLNQFNELSVNDGLAKNLLLDSNLVVQYPIPIGERTRCRSITKTLSDTYTINWWSLASKDIITEEIIVEAFYSHGKDAHEKSIQNKIENTLNFFNFIKDKSLHDLVK